VTQPVDTAKVDLPLPKDANAKATILVCKGQSSVIRAVPAFPTTPAVQAAVDELDAEVGVLEGIVGELDGLHAKAGVLEASRNKQLGVVRLKHDSVKTALNSSTNGDPVAAAQWLGQTVERAKPSQLPPSTDPPLNATLNLIKRHPGSVIAKCAEDADAIGYLFQAGSDPSQPDTWPKPFYSNGFTWKFRDLPPGQPFYVRIAIMRRGSVQGAWSAVLSILVR
jgi:hypothetical protein